jgi:UrcA family protein
MIFLHALLAAAATCAAIPAPAQHPGSPLQYMVTHADLDLSTRRGIRRLDQRIRSAVRLACGPLSDVDPAGRNRIRACRRALMAEAHLQRDQAIAARSGESKVDIATR